jgi:hypothetical protein
VVHQDNACRFVHDRIQQAAYSLIPEAERAEVHLDIGRVLLASLTADELDEDPFDVANHFNRGATLLVDRDEKAQVATIELRAGRKAKASTAYASACTYVVAGMALLDESDWDSQYDLAFSLWLERAECEYLTGQLASAEARLSLLSTRARTIVDSAAVTRVRINLYTNLDQQRQRCRGGPGLSPAVQRRVVAAPDGRGRTAGIRSVVAAAGVRLNRGAARLTADERSGPVCYDGRAHGAHVTGPVHGLESLSSRRRSDGSPQPGTWQQ